MTWTPGKYGFDTRAAYDAEVARKQAAGIPLTQKFIPPTATPAPKPAPVVTPSPTGGASPLTGAQKAAELGMTDFMSQAKNWGNPAAYQNFMTGTQALQPAGNKPPEDVKPPGLTREEVERMFADAMAGVTGQFNNMFGNFVTQQRNQYDQQLNPLIQRLQTSIQNIPNIQNIMSSPAMQQMMAAIQGQTDDQMKRARADLAARGVLGEGSTPAAERFGQVAAQAGQQMGALIPSMMNTAMGMQGQQTSALQNLVNLLSGLDQQDWQRGITEFGTYAPYTRLTAAQRAELANNLIMNVPALQGFSQAEIMEWLDTI